MSEIIKILFVFIWATLVIVLFSIIIIQSFASLQGTLMPEIRKKCISDFLAIFIIFILLTVIPVSLLIKYGILIGSCSFLFIAFSLYVAGYYLENSK